MTDDAKLVLLKTMYDGEYCADDAVLSAYLTMAGQIIINRAYPYKDDVDTVPTKYEQLQLEIAIYLLDKIGAEGETAHNENGINRTYESAGVPDSMLKQVIPFAGI